MFLIIFPFRNFRKSILRIFSHFFEKGSIVTAQSSLSSNYIICLRVTAEGANQNAQRSFFNTEIILSHISLVPIKPERYPNSFITYSTLKSCMDYPVITHSQP